MIKKVRDTVPWTNACTDVNGEEIARTFYEKELKKKKIQKSLELKK